MDEIKLIQSLHRIASAAPADVSVDPQLLRQRVWEAVDTEEQASPAPLLYLVIAGAIAASLVMILTWDCQDLFDNSLYWLDPVMQHYQF